MAWRGNISKSLKELRILLCQSSPASAPARTFVEKNYKDLKSLNPKFPFLIRECSGIQPQMWARYAKPRGLGSSYGFIDRRPFPFPCRQISELTEANGKRGVDTLAMVKSLEAQGVPSKQAEAITSAITKAFDDCLENAKMSHSRLVVDEFAKLQEELDKYRAEVATMEAELSCEHRICTNRIAKDIIKADSDLHKEFVQLRVEYEAGKLQAVKYAMGTLALAAIGFSWFLLMK